MIDGPVRHNLGQSLKSTFVSMSRKSRNRKQKAERHEDRSGMEQLENWTQESRTDKPFSMIYRIQIMIFQPLISGDPRLAKQNFLDSPCSMPAQAEVEPSYKINWMKAETQLGCHGTQHSSQSLNRCTLHVQEIH